MAVFMDNALKLAVSVAVLAVLGAIMFPLRIYVRINKKALGLDDWCMIAAAVPWLGLSVACIYGASQGIGVHEARLNTHEKEVTLLWFWLFEVLWCITIIPVKLSIFLMLARIADVRRPYVISLYVAAGITTTTNLIALLYIVLRCAPVSAAWSIDTMGTQCQPGYMLAKIYYAATTVNIVADWFCALLPIPLLRKSSLDVKARLSACLLLGLGALASISACVRFKYTVALTESHDLLFSYGDLVLWGYAEVGVGFLVSSLSTLRPLWSMLFPHSGSLPTTHDLHALQDIRKVTRQSIIRINSEESLMAPDHCEGETISASI